MESYEVRWRRRAACFPNVITVPFSFSLTLTKALVSYSPRRSRSNQRFRLLSQKCRVPSLASRRKAQGALTSLALFVSLALIQRRQYLDEISGEKARRLVSFPSTIAIYLTISYSYFHKFVKVCIIVYLPFHYSLTKTLGMESWETVSLDIHPSSFAITRSTSIYANRI